MSKIQICCKLAPAGKDEFAKKIFIKNNNILTFIIAISLMSIYVSIFAFILALLDIYINLNL